jgi:FixJ family two-component response regulator
VADDESGRDALRAFIRPVGYDFLDSNVLDKRICLIVDVHMPGMTGLKLQCRLDDRQCQIPIIFITAGDDPAVQAPALKPGAVDFLRKPFAGDRLLVATRGS